MSRRQVFMHRMTMSVVCILLGLTACGSASDEAAINDVETTVAAVSTTAVSTTAVSTTAAPTAEASDDGADSEYCALSRASDLLDEEFNGYNDPVALESYFVELTGLVEQASAVVPPEIATEFGIIEAEIVAVATATAASGYDFSVMLTAIEENTGAEPDAVYDVIDDYDEAVCGL